MFFAARKSEVACDFRKLKNNPKANVLKRAAAAERYLTVYLL
jgi:hypothetical protein